MTEKSSNYSAVRSFILHWGLRASIWLLRSIAPISVILVIYFWSYGIPEDVWLQTVYYYALVETTFFFCVYWPLQNHLQDPARHPEWLSREERELLLKRCHDTTEDAEVYLSKWFHGSPLDQIKKDNLREFLAWAFWGASRPETVDSDDLDDCVEALEETLGRTFEPGRGTAKSLRVTVDEVGSMHRPLIWFVIVGVIEFMTAFRLWNTGYVYYRQRFPMSMMSFPISSFSLLTNRVSSSKNIPYWYKAHTSKTRKPILFLHGIGIGFYPYTRFLEDLSTLQDEQGGQVGILILEFLPIFSRLTSPIPLNAELRRQILSILDSHGWNSFVLAANSYGSIVTTQLLHDPRIAPRMASMLLVDPVVFLLHLPDVAYNFTVRMPSNTMEHALWYFASKDPMVAHTLQRRSFWVENILWKEELQGKDITVALAEKDDIVNTPVVRKYLVGGDSGWSWTGKGLDTLWFEKRSHAEMFQWARERRTLIDVLDEYSKKNSSSVELDGTVH